MHQLATKTSAFMKSRSLQRQKKTRKDNQLKKTRSNTLSQPQVGFLPTPTSPKSCSSTVKKPSCTVPMKKTSLVPSDTVDIPWVSTNKFTKFSPIQKESTKWSSVLMITTFSLSVKKANLFATNSRIKIPKIRWKSQTCLKSFFTQSKNWLGKRNCLINWRHKIQMPKKKETNFCESPKLSMIVWLMNGTLRSLKGKGSKNKNMIRKFNKSVEWKKNSLINLQDFKLSIRKSVKLLKKTTPTSSSWSRHVSVNWAKWEKLTTEDSMNWFKPSRTTTLKENIRIKCSMKRRSLNKLRRKIDLTKSLRKTKRNTKMNSKDSKTKPKDKSRSKSNKTNPISRYYKNKTTNPKPKKDTRRHNTTSSNETSNNRNTGSSIP